MILILRLHKYVTGWSASFTTWCNPSRDIFDAKFLGVGWSNNPLSRKNVSIRYHNALGDCDFTECRRLSNQFYLLIFAQIYNFINYVHWIYCMALNELILLIHKHQ